MAINLSSLKEAFDKLDELREAAVFNNMEPEVFANLDESAKVTAIFQKGTEHAAEVLKSVIELMEENCTLEMFVSRRE